MFESLSAKGPKLVYSHNRQTLPERKTSDKTSPTPISVGPRSSAQLQSHVIPRPSVTVVAQTRKTSEEGHAPHVSLEGGVSSSPGNVSILTSVSRNIPPSGMVLADKQNRIQTNSYYQHSGPGQTEVYGNYSRTTSDANGHPHDYPAKGDNNSTENVIPVDIERVNSLENNEKTNGNSTDYDTLPYSFNNSGYHGGYRVYQGKVYEITREIPIILADSNLPTRPSPSQKFTKTPISNGKPTHSSIATASIIKTGSVTNSQMSHTNSPLTDKSQEQPRALPSPKLNGKTPNGVLHSSPLATSDFNNQFREHRRPQDDLRLLDVPERLTHVSGAHSMRRPNTVGGKKSVRDLSPQAWAVRGWAGPVSSPVTVGSASRRASSHHSASGTKTIPLRGTGGHIWTVITNSPPHSPRPRRSSSTGQQVVTRASYRLDPEIAAKLQRSSPASGQPTKSILKTSNNPVTSSGKTEQYDNHPLPSDRSQSTSPYLLPRARASLAYRDFDFSSLPPQQPTATLAKTPKHSIQQATSIPMQRHRGKSPAAHSSTSRRPATAGAALQKDGGTFSKGSQPQKKSVTFNSQVRLHVDSNVSTIRSLSTDS